MIIDYDWDFISLNFFRFHLMYLFEFYIMWAWQKMLVWFDNKIAILLTFDTFSMNNNVIGIVIR